MRRTGVAPDHPHTNQVHGSCNVEKWDRAFLRVMDQAEVKRRCREWIVLDCGLLLRRGGGVGKARFDTRVACRCW